MSTAWYLLLGLFFAGYLMLAGYDYGVGLLLARRGDDPATALNAVGPFFLGNEVWLVATVGVLFGAFPRLEGALLSGLYPVVAPAVAGAVLVTAAVQLRARAATATGQARWGRLVVVGSVLAAGGWGATLGGMLQGIPAPGGPVVTAFTGACALSLVALAAAHGAAFLAVRLPGGPAAVRHARLAATLAGVALAALTGTAVVGLLSPGVRAAAHRPGPALLGLGVLAGSLLAVRAAVARGRHRTALAATTTAIGTPVLLVGLATWPYALVAAPGPADSLTVAQAAASGATLTVLSALLVPLLPALVGFQLMCRWVFRTSSNPPTVGFY